MQTPSLSTQSWLREHECSWYNIKCLKKALALYFPSPAFRRNGAVQYLLPQFSSKPSSGHSSLLKRETVTNAPLEGLQNGVSSVSINEAHKVLHTDLEDENLEDDDSTGVNYFVLPIRASDDSVKMQHESYTVMLRQLRDQILSMPRRSFARPISERDWLRNAARVWDSIKKSPVLADYSRTLQNSGLYRR